MDDSQRFSRIPTGTKYHKEGFCEWYKAEFKVGNNKVYKVDGIWDSTVYAREPARQLSGLYYLVLWKSYPEKKNTWKSALVIQHFQRLVIAYHKDNSKKPTVISPSINLAPLMAGPTVKPTIAPTKKRAWPAKTNTNKRVKKF